MSLHHIPVRIIAVEGAEFLAFADILKDDLAGVLAIAGDNERPLAALITPSGDPMTSGDIPTVILGARNGPVPTGAQIIPTPAKLCDVLEALEMLATTVSGLSAARDFKGWSLEPARLTVQSPDGRRIGLTDTESRLLACLFDAQGAIVSRDALLQRVWGYRPGLDTHTLETHIYRLRKKVEADPASPKVIITANEGYYFAA